MIRILGRSSAALLLVIGGCVNALPVGSHELLVGDTGDRICGDSTVFVHEIGPHPVVEEHMILSSDSLRWGWMTDLVELRLEAPIDRRLVMREAVLKTHYATDSLGKSWANETGRLEIRGDTAQYSVGDKEAHVQRGPIARDAAVMMAPSATFAEILVRRARMTGRDSVEFPAYFLGANYTPTAEVRFIRRDSVRIGFENDNIVTYATVDSVGRILSGQYQARGDSDVVKIRRLRCTR